METRSHVTSHQGLTLSLRARRERLTQLTNVLFSFPHVTVT